jgi:redox-sensitive bicupin YhaK (pirin superfamily)
VTHFLQIWIIPKFRGLKPGYEQIAFPAEQKRGRLRLVASPDGADGSVTVHQDARMYAGLFDGAEHAELELEPGRLGYVHVVRGQVTVNGEKLGAGDALLYRDEPRVIIGGGKDAEVLVFNLPTLQ